MVNFILDKIILRKICKMLVCYIPNCNFHTNKNNSLNCREREWQLSRFGYAYSNGEINFERIKDFK